MARRVVLFWLRFGLLSDDIAAVKPSSAKSKGRALQKYVAARIQEVFGLPETDVVSRPMGSGGRDIMLSDRALKALPVSFEVKNTKVFPGLSALEQSAYNAGEHAPVVAWKPPGKGMEKTLVYMDLEMFLHFVKRHCRRS